MPCALGSIRVFQFLFPPSLLPSNRKWISSISRKKSAQAYGDLKDHLRLLFGGWKDRDEVSYEFELVSALKSCSSLAALGQGEQIHSLILKTGLDSNIFVHNSLINLYVKCGFIEVARLMFDASLGLDTASWNTMLVGYVKLSRLEDACQLFEKMPGKDCVSFTTMIMGLAQSDQPVEALKVFKEMQAIGMSPNEVTLASVISAYAHLPGTRNGSMLHGLTIKAGLCTFTLVSTNLIHIYSVNSRIRDAKIIFDNMPDSNIVAWNVMLNGYSKLGLIDSAGDLFEKFPVKDIVSWSTMINVYVQADRLMEAMDVYCQMFRTGIRPNEVMIVDLISACGRLMAIDHGQQYHCIATKTGLDCYDFMQTTIIHFYAACSKIKLACLQFELCSKDNISSWNAVIAGFARNKMIDSARAFFNAMPVRDVVSWSTIIAAYSQIGQTDSTLELFGEMLSKGIRPNEITMVSVLSAIASMGNLIKGRWIHNYIHKNSIPLNDNLSAGLIDMYAKCGSLNSALELFNQIQGKTTTASPWNAAIYGLAVHGHAELSLRIFSDMQRKHINPNSITFIGVLTACCHAGLVEAGEEYFECMKKLHNIEPNIKHYGCMVDLLGRAGRVAEAEQLIARMPMEADFVIWGTLLSACRTHGNVEIGQRAAENLARLDPAHGAGRILLSNIYANAERWDDVFDIRRVMQSKKMNKLPGCSGIV